jgi:hypothetical protein
MCQHAGVVYRRLNLWQAVELAGGGFCDPEKGLKRILASLTAQAALSLGRARRLAFVKEKEQLCREI